MVLYTYTEPDKTTYGGPS